MRIYKEFLFEAAHYLPSAPPGHPNSRIHGHSFRARVTVEGEPNAETAVRRTSGLGERRAARRTGIASLENARV